MDMTAGRSVQGDFAHRELVILSPPREVSPEFRTALTSLVQGYEQLAAALFEGDLGTAQQRAESLRGEVEEVEAEGLSGVGADAWEQHRHVLRTSLHQLSEAETIDDARTHFSHASEALYCALKSFGGAEHPVFVVYCRMAFDGRGAYWLSSDPRIRNPYMAPAMPACGQRRETIRVRSAPPAN